MSEQQTPVSLRPPVAQRPLAQVLNNADASIRRDDQSDEIGAMVWATVMHRRQQLGGSIPTPNDHRRAELMKRIVMDATGEIVRSPLSHDQTTVMLEKIAASVSEQQAAG